MVRVVTFVFCLCSLAGIFGSAGAADRDTLLSDPGVYGTFAVFQIDDEWWSIDKAARSTAASTVKEVFQKHADKVAIDTYLTRGLSDRADFWMIWTSSPILKPRSWTIFTTWSWLLSR